MWKVDPQNASLYEDALAVHDQEITARGDRERAATPVEIEGPVRQTIEVLSIWMCLARPLVILRPAAGVLLALP